MLRHSFRSGEPSIDQIRHPIDLPDPHWSLQDRFFFRHVIAYPAAHHCRVLGPSIVHFIALAAWLRVSVADVPPPPSTLLLFLFLFQSFLLLWSDVWFRFRLYRSDDPDSIALNRGFRLNIETPIIAVHISLVVLYTISRNARLLSVFTSVKP